jgi:hypothetical protein
MDHTTRTTRDASKQFHSEKDQLARDLRDAKEQLDEERRLKAQLKYQSDGDDDVLLTDTLNNNDRTVLIAKQIFSATTHVSKSTKTLHKSLQPAQAPHILNNVESNKLPPAVAPVPPDRHDSIDKFKRAQSASPMTAKKIAPQVPPKPSTPLGQPPTSQGDSEYPSVIDAGCFIWE